MVDTPKVESSEPILPAGASVDEARQFQDIVRRHGPWPEGVRRVEFRFSEDSAGAPAIWIVFIAGDDLNPSKERVAEEVRSEVRRLAASGRRM
jgi:hypothetical protein